MRSAPTDQTEENGHYGRRAAQQQHIPALNADGLI
jgi:hypothetical protein